MADSPDIYSLSYLEYLSIYIMAKFYTKNLLQKAQCYYAAETILSIYLNIYLENHKKQTTTTTSFLNDLESLEGSYQCCQ